MKVEIHAKCYLFILVVPFIIQTYTVTAHARVVLGMQFQKNPCDRI
jgi:hypothetical protein